MKQSTRILITLGVYILLIAGIVLFANYYVDRKSKRLWKEFVNNYEKVFENQPRYIKVAFSGESITYEQEKIPSRNSYTNEYDTIFSESFKYHEQQDWEKDYGDLVILYRLASRWKPKKDYDEDHKYSGWLLYGIGKVRDYGIYAYVQYPVFVGYRRQNYDFSYQYMSVEKAINQAFNYWTTESYDATNMTSSDFSPYSLMNKIKNEYFTFYNYDAWVTSHGEAYADSMLYHGRDGFFTYRTISCFRPSMTWFQNRYYRVFMTQKVRDVWNYSYDYWKDPKKKDRMRIILIGSIIVSIFVLPFLIYFIRQYRRERKLAKETLKEQLCRVSNPENFMDPFDKVRVDIANDLYSRINQTDETDIEALKALRREVSEQLGIDFTDDKKRVKLIKKCDPKNFMNPYNEEKVRIATELYDKLCSSNLDVDEMEEIEEAVKQLYAKKES